MLTVLIFVNLSRIKNLIVTKQIREISMVAHCLTLFDYIKLA